MSRQSRSKAAGAIISVARDFSPHPGPRFKRQGPYSGELFRKLLVEALGRHQQITVDLDGTSGFGSSFLDEAFGGLVSEEGFSRDELQRRLFIKSDEDETYRAEVLESIALAEPKREFA